LPEWKVPDWRCEIHRRLDGLRLAPERAREIVDELALHRDDRARSYPGSNAEWRMRAISLREATAGALLRALTGVYVTACATGERRHEIGVRVGLGATPRSVARLIVGSSFRLIVIEVCGGVPPGFAIATTMPLLLFGVGAADPTTCLLVIAAVTSAALAAGYIPARRAMSIDPIAVLKQE
jgi:hypothetical protein